MNKSLHCNEVIHFSMKIRECNLMKLIQVFLIRHIQLIQICILTKVLKISDLVMALYCLI